MSFKTWKETAAERRDARATKEETSSRPHNRRKNKKLWCRGKEGVAHQPECQNYYPDHSMACFSHWKLLVCKVCGKRLDFYANRDGKNKPDWVK